jgi:putative flippase GtrA
VFKYAVDKFWVFEDQDRTVQGNSRKFVMYALFGVLTTAMFWGVELAFHYAFQTAIMTNVGAIVGLTLGYVIKYNLDKNISFRDRTRDLASP